MAVIETESTTETSYADSAWKDALKFFFKDFIKLCWYEAYKAIDWSIEPEFLEQELFGIVYRRKEHKKVTDKLVKVRLRDGKDAIVLIHIEIQGGYEVFFVERMFIYRHRIFDHFRLPVASLAILTDSRPGWYPNTFSNEIWGSSVEFKFPIIKILDFKSKKKELMESRNPFAILILAQLAAIEASKVVDKKFVFKVRLTRLLYDKGWSKNRILHLYRFLEGLLVLPKELDMVYHEEVKKIQGEHDMSYLTTAERVGQKNLLLSQLECKFKDISNDYKNRVKVADENSIGLWSRRILTAQKIEEIFV